MPPVLARLGTIALLGLLSIGGSLPTPAATPFPTGTWLTEDGRARVRTERCGTSKAYLCGYVVWLQNPMDDAGKPRVDQYNPDKTKQRRPVLGHQMLLGLRPNPESHYEGKVYSGDNGKFYDVTVWSDAPEVLTVKGCMLIFCGSQAWKRVSDVLPGQLQGVTDLPGGPSSDPEWVVKPTAVEPTLPRKAQPTDR